MLKDANGKNLDDVYAKLVAAYGVSKANTNAGAANPKQQSIGDFFPVGWKLK